MAYNDPTKRSDNRSKCIFVAMSSWMSSPRNCSNGRVRSAESSRLRTRPHVIPVDRSVSLTRARSYEIERSTMLGLQQPAGECHSTTCTREFLEDRGKELRRTGYMVECQADRGAKYSFTINPVLVYSAVTYWYA